MRSWRYSRNLLAYYLTLLLLILAAAAALREPLFWAAAALLWLLHQAFRQAIAFAHPARRLTPLPDSLEGFRPVQFQSRDGLTLSAQFAASRSGGTLILAHGLGASGQDLAVLARLLVREGFGVLLMDLRAHGASGGDASTLGWKEGEDIACAAAYLRTRIDVHGGKIGAYGFSLGAQAALGGAALDPEIRALALEGLGPARLSDHGGSPRSLLRWINLPFNWSFYRVFEWMVGGRPPGVMELIPTIAPRPILLIAGGGSEVYFNRLFRQAARGPVELWEAPEAGHGGLLARRPDEYMQKLTGFFKKSLNSESD